MTNAGHDGSEASLPEAARQLLLDQREANEKLVLATLRAQELTDAAEAALRLAEEASNRADAANQAAQALAQKLAISERELLATGEFRERLLAMVGHDLRNPLNAILMSASLLGKETTLSERDIRFVARIYKSAHRMSQMIGELLEFTRARLGGGLVLDLENVDLREICQNVAEELEVGARAQVQSELVGDLTGLWDADRLAALLSNIVSNAVDHALPGTPVTICARETGQDVVVEISNRGEGIPDEILPVIFEPFRRAHLDGGAKVGHLGLGLYIAFEVVRAHGGDLTARSAEGTTSFLFRLPRQPRAAVEPVTSEGDPPRT